jgi:hypothetical protein
VTDPGGSRSRDTGSPVATGGLATLLESLKIDNVFIDLEESLEKVCDMVTVIEGSLKTVMTHWNSLSEADRTDLITRAQKRAIEIIPALEGDSHTRLAALRSPAAIASD